MKSLKKYLFLFTLFALFVGCDDFFEPQYNNNLSSDAVFNTTLTPQYTEGLYVPAYAALAGNYMTFGGDFLDAATDNAVSNNYNSNAWRMRTIPGFFTARTYPFYTWGSRYRYIKDIYQFFAVGLEDDIVYRTSHPERNRQLKERMKGEAHFLLALSYFQLLRDYAGPVDGKMMGVPLVKGVITADEAKQLERNTYDECVDFIIAHIDTAMSSGLLPEYSNTYIGANPDKGYQATIYGDLVQGLPTTTACKALKSRVLLYASSPAFTINKSDEEKEQLYMAAAEAAKEVIDAVGDLPNIYNLAKLDDEFFTKVNDNRELILSRASQTAEWEKTNYPPVLGLQVQGRTNPSQNLVDAFPMNNGYPISDLANSGYDKDNPYQGRDNRFYMTVIHNNMNFKGTNIEIYPGGNSFVGGPNISDDSRVTRTGYYLRKWMTEQPSFISGVASVTPWHFKAEFRAVEAYLNFAEAANAAVGPDTKIDGLSAREALRAIRKRAGVPTTGDASVSSDPYLAGLTELTPLIKNERRIELCFEGHRYYDVRRWNDDMNTTVKGVSITTNDGGFTFNYEEENVFPNQVDLPEYMRYGAIPRGEIRIIPNLKQNDGWQ